MIDINALRFIQFTGFLIGLLFILFVISLFLLIITVKELKLMDNFLINNKIIQKYKNWKRLVNKYGL